MTAGCRVMALCVCVSFNSLAEPGSECASARVHFHASVCVRCECVCLGGSRASSGLHLSCLSETIIHTYTNTQAHTPPLCAVSVNSVCVCVCECRCPHLRPGTSDSEREKGQKKKQTVCLSAPALNYLSLLITSSIILFIIRADKLSKLLTGTVCKGLS